MNVDADLRPAYSGGFVWANPELKEKQIDHGIVFDVNSLFLRVCIMKIYLMKLRYILRENTNTMMNILYGWVLLVSRLILNKIIFHVFHLISLVDFW